MDKFLCKIFGHKWRIVGCGEVAAGEIYVTWELTGKQLARCTRCGASGLC